MDRPTAPRRIALVAEPVHAAHDDGGSAAATAEAPRPRVRRYRLARLEAGLDSEA